MTKEDLMKRTMDLSLRVIKLVRHLPGNEVSSVISNQILRSSTSVGSNYRAACRSKSRKDFISKMKIVEEETDETLFWLVLIEKSELVRPEQLASLKDECTELLSIFVSSIKTARDNLRITNLKSGNKSTIVNRQ